MQFNPYDGSPPPPASPAPPPPRPPGRSPRLLLIADQQVSEQSLEIAHAGLLEAATQGGPIYLPRGWAVYQLVAGVWQLLHAG